MIVHIEYLLYLTLKVLGVQRSSERNQCIKESNTIVHLGQSVPGCTCRPGDKRLESSHTERVLGVLVDGIQGDLEARRANHILGHQA